MDDPRDSVLTARLVMVIQCSIGLVLMSSYAIIQSVALAEKRQTVIQLLRSKDSDRTLLWIMAMTFLNLGFYVGTMIMYTVDWRANPEGCRLLGKPFVPAMFFIAKQFLYYFLYERSCIVHDSLRMSRGAFRTYRRIIALFIVAGIP